MNISSVLGALLRRWYVTLLVLGATAYVASQLWADAQPEYSSSSVVSVVAAPGYLLAQQSDDPLLTIGNPYGSGSATLAALLADSVANGNVTLGPGTEGAALDVQISQQRAESFFTVASTAPSREAALAAVLAVEEQAPAILADIQQRAGAPADQLFTSILARPATDPIEQYPDRVRLVLGTTLAGLLAAALLASLVDGAVISARASRTRRRRQAAARAEDAAASDAQGVS